MRATLHTFVARARELFDRGYRRRQRAELDEEMALHLELEIAHHVANGMRVEEARRRALVDFGPMQRFREEATTARGSATAEALLRELRLSLRRFAAAPVLAAGAIGTLGVGLAAAVSIGTLVYAVMLRPLPYDGSDRIVKIDLLTPGNGDASTDHPAGTIAFYGERARALSAVGGYSENDGITLGGETPERVAAGMITPNVLDILRVRPILGRAFRAEDARADTVPVLISHELWTSRFAGDRSIIGRRIMLNRGRREVIGVLPPDVHFPSRRTMLWYPMNVDAGTLDLSGRFIGSIARLADGADLAVAQQELETLTARLRERFPDVPAADLERSGIRPRVLTLHASTVGAVRDELTMLGGMVAFVLLIALANVGTLLLLRGERLRGETSISRALGATDARIMTRFIVEGLVLGAAAAIVAAPIVTLALVTRFGVSPLDVPRLHEVEFSWPPLLLLAALAVLVGLLLGLVVAWQAVGGRDRTMRVDARTLSHGWQRARMGLVAGQVALALALLAGAMLMTESLLRLRATPLGFVANGATSFELVLPFRTYPGYERTSAFHRDVLTRLRAVPGVRSASASMGLPLVPAVTPARPLHGDGRSDGASFTADINITSDRFFETMGMRVERGRDFTRAEFLTASESVVISRALADALFPGVDPVGLTVRVPGERGVTGFRVVGVASDVPGARLIDGASRVLYFPLLAGASTTDRGVGALGYAPVGMRYVLRSEAEPAALLLAVRRIVRAIDPTLPVSNVTTLTAIVEHATAGVRLITLLLVVAAGVALLLGTVGLYSVIAYAVAGRRHEFAIRVALGATAGRIQSLVARDGMRVVAAGALGGVLLAAAGVGVIRSMLYRTDIGSPLPYVGALGGLLLVAAIAIAVPARRAGRTDPAGALRAP